MSGFSRGLSEGISKNIREKRQARIAEEQAYGDIDALMKDHEKLSQCYDKAKISLEVKFPNNPVSPHLVESEEWTIDDYYDIHTIEEIEREPLRYYLQQISDCQNQFTTAYTDDLAGDARFLSDKATSEIMLQVAQYYAGNQNRGNTKLNISQILLNYEKETNTVLKSRKRIYQDALRIADAEELKRQRTNFSEGIDLSEYKINRYKAYYCRYYNGWLSCY